MSQLAQVLLTFVLTVGGGIVVYVAGQLISRFYLEPIDKLRQVIGEIASDMIFLANVYANPGAAASDEAGKTSRILRTRASDLAARANAISRYGFWAQRGLIPAFAGVVKAHQELIGLSNSIQRGEGLENDERRERIQDALGIHPALR